MAQSGLDKIFNWEGELDFITEKFSKTILSNFSIIGLIQVTILETLSGLLSLLGSIMVLFYDDQSYGIVGLILWPAIRIHNDPAARIRPTIP
jgi:hypothetical protein